MWTACECQPLAGQGSALPAIPLAAEPHQGVLEGQAFIIVWPA